MIYEHGPKIRCDYIILTKRKYSMPGYRSTRFLRKQNSMKVNRKVSYVRQPYMAASTGFCQGLFQSNPQINQNLLISDFK